MDTRIQNHFKRTDPVLYAAARGVGKLEKIEPKNPREYFTDLCRKIVGQQVSGKAAESIFGRFLALFRAGRPTPRGLLRLPDTTLAAAGISGAKASYLRNLAAAAESGALNLARLETADDDEVRRELLAIKGIGPWTVEMFLIFTLGREDVFSLGDLGLRNAVRLLYRVERPSAEYLTELAHRWSPYRSYASRVLWRTLDATNKNRSKPTA